MIEIGLCWAPKGTRVARNLYRKDLYSFKNTLVDICGIDSSADVPATLLQPLVHLLNTEGFFDG